MKEFISYNEMKRILFPTDIQSETFIMPDESIYDDFMDADGYEADITETDVNCNMKQYCLEDEVNCIEVLKPENAHDYEQNIETVNDTMPVYPLEGLYKDINIEDKEMSDNNLYNIVSKTPTAVDISETKSTTNYQAVPNRREPKNYLISANYAKVRILHAASGFKKLNISIGSRRTSERLPFGMVSNYVNIIDGYRTVSVSDAETGLLIMYDVLPFITGSKVTIVVFNTAAGMELSVVPDNICRNKMKDKSCFRVANFTFDDGPFDLLLSNMSGIFNDIRTKEVTSFKQASDGDYSFYVVDTLYNIIPYDYSVDHMLCSREEHTTDISVIKSPEYILDIYVKFRKNTTYTIYIIGGLYPEVPIQEIIVENE